jgi:hypothetical protein
MKVAVKCAVPREGEQPGHEADAAFHDLYERAQRQSEVASLHSESNFGRSPTHVRRRSAAPFLSQGDPAAQQESQARTRRFRRRSYSAFELSPQEDEATARASITFDQSRSKDTGAARVDAAPHAVEESHDIISSGMISAAAATPQSLVLTTQSATPQSLVLTTQSATPQSLVLTTQSATPQSLVLTTQSASPRTESSPSGAASAHATSPRQASEISYADADTDRGLGRGEVRVSVYAISGYSPADSARADTPEAGGESAQSALVRKLMHCTWSACAVDTLCMSTVAIGYTLLHDFVAVILCQCRIVCLSTYLYCFLWIGVCMPFGFQV